MFCNKATAASLAGEASAVAKCTSSALLSVKEPFSVRCTCCVCARSWTSQAARSAWGRGANCTFSLEITSEEGDGIDGIVVPTSLGKLQRVNPSPSLPPLPERHPPRHRCRWHPALSLSRRPPYFPALICIVVLRLLAPSAPQCSTNPDDFLYTFSFHIFSIILYKRVEVWGMYMTQ